MMTTLFDRELQDKEMARLFAQEQLIEEATELIAEVMHERGITKSELASRVGTSRGHITQLLAGSRNMTLRTLADLMHAMGSRVFLKSSSSGDSECTDGIRWVVHMTEPTKQQWENIETISGVAGTAA